MFISCKCLTLLPMQLFVGDTVLTSVDTVKSSDMSWSPHINKINAKTRRLNWAILQTFLFLYTSYTCHTLYFFHSPPSRIFAPIWNMRPPPSVVFLSVVFSVFLFLLHRNLAMRQVMSLLYLISLITEILTASVQKISLSEALTGFNKTITTLDDRRLLIGIGSNIEVRVLTHRHRRKILPN